MWAQLVGVIALASLPQDPGSAMPSDAFLGTWNLERERSHYAETTPERMTVVIDAVPQGLHYRSSTQYAGGRTGTSDYTASFDGTPTLVVGSAGFLAPISLRRIDEANIEATYTSGLKKIAWSRWSVNAVGTELVVTTIYVVKDGDNRQNVAVFRHARTP